MFHFFLPYMSVNISPNFLYLKSINERVRSMRCMCVCSVMSDSLGPPWTVARQAPLSMDFFRQEYWSGLPFPSPRDLLNPGIQPISPVSPALQAYSLLAEP